MGNTTLFIYALHLLFLTWSASTLAQPSQTDTVEEACSVTRYRELCVQTLVPFYRVSPKTPYLWARGGVVVTIWELKAVASYVNAVRNSGNLSGRSLTAIRDCAEVIDAALNWLQDSLQVLRNLNRGTFEPQMGEVIAWLRTAITDENRCTAEMNVGGGGQILSSVGSMVTNATRLTSNALALANSLASSGFPSSLPNTNSKIHT